MTIDDMEGQEVTLRSILTSEMDPGVLEIVLSTPVPGWLQFMPTMVPLNMRSMQLQIGYSFERSEGASRGVGSGGGGKEVKKEVFTSERTGSMGIRPRGWKGHVSTT